MAQSIPIQQDCQIIGDADLYGLGVRVAVYAQAIAYLALASNRASPRMVLEVPSLVTVFLMYSVLVLRAFQGRLRPFDTMLTLFSVGSLGSVAPLEEPAVIAERKKTLSGRIMYWGYNISTVTQLVFGIWAVMNNLTLGPGQEHCRVWIYTFSKQPNHGWAMGLWKGYYWFCAVFYSLRWVVGKWGILRRWILAVAARVYPPKTTPGQSKTRLHHQPVKPDLVSIPLVTKPNAAFLSQDRRELPTGNFSHNSFVLPRKQVHTGPKFFILATSFFWVVGFNIIGGELMLHWNGVQGVNSLDTSGQTMALLAGLFTLIQFGWQLCGLSST